MICIEERGGKPEQAGSIESRRRIDPISARSFALRFRLGASLAGIDRIGGIGGRLDIAVAQVAATYADLKRNNRIYFTRFRRYFSLVFLFLFFFFRFSSLSSFAFLLFEKPPSGYMTKFAISHLLRVHGNATDRRWPAFFAAGATLAYLEWKKAEVTRECDDKDSGDVGIFHFAIRSSD